MLLVHYLYKHMRRCRLMRGIISFTSFTRVDFAGSTLVFHPLNSSLTKGASLPPLVETNLHLSLAIALQLQRFLCQSFVHLLHSLYLDVAYWFAVLLLQLLQGLSKRLVVLSSFLAFLATILQRLLALLSLINKQLIHSLPTHNFFKLFLVPQVSRAATIAFIVHCIVIAIRDCKGVLHELQ
jgi:hypothetical protein